MDLGSAQRFRVRDYGGAGFYIRRLAILPEDIEEFNLPPLKVKMTDTRAPSFIERYGEDCVELDALPVEELRRRLDVEIHSLIDWGKWNRAVMVEQAEIASIVQTVSQWPGAGASS